MASPAKVVFTREAWKQAKRLPREAHEHLRVLMEKVASCPDCHPAGVDIDRVEMCKPRQVYRLKWAVWRVVYEAEICLVDRNKITVEWVGHRKDAYK